MIKCIIIDNKISCVKILAKILLSFADHLEVIGKFTCSETAVKFLGNTKVDLVFLNVEMPKTSSTHIIAQFPATYFQPIFSTSHSQYAIEAIEKNKVDYILKPLDPVKIGDCIQRIIKDLKNLNTKIELETSLGKSEELYDQKKKIRIFTAGKIFFFDPEEIIYCEAAGSYTHIFLTYERKILVSHRLKSVGYWLPKDLFLRVHHSYIVHIFKVIEFHHSKNHLLLEQGISIPVSRLKKKEVLNKLP